MDGGAWWATVHGVAKSWTQMSDFTFSFNPSHRVVVRIWLRIWKQLIEVGKDLKGLCNLNLVYNQKNLSHNKGFPGGSSDKESACQRATGDTGLIPGLGKNPREGNGNPLQYSWQDNPMDSGAWKATVHGFIKSPTQVKQRRTHAHPTMSLVSQFFFKGYLPSYLLYTRFYSTWFPWVPTMGQCNYMMCFHSTMLDAHQEARGPCYSHTDISLVPSVPCRQHTT